MAPSMRIRYWQEKQENSEFSGRGDAGGNGLWGGKEPDFVTGHERYQGELNRLCDVRLAINLAGHTSSQKTNGSIRFACVYCPLECVCVSVTKLHPLQHELR